MPDFVGSPDPDVDGAMYGRPVSWYARRPPRSDSGLDASITGGWLPP
jgi:hypothetical protein